MSGNRATGLVGAGGGQQIVSSKPQVEPKEPVVAAAPSTAPAKEGWVPSSEPARIRAYPPFAKLQVTIDAAYKEHSKCKENPLGWEADGWQLALLGETDLTKYATWKSQVTGDSTVSVSELNQYLNNPQGAVKFITSSMMLRVEEKLKELTTASGSTDGLKTSVEISTLPADLQSVAKVASRGAPTLTLEQARAEFAKIRNDSNIIPSKGERISFANDGTIRVIRGKVEQVIEHVWLTDQMANGLKASLAKMTGEPDLFRFDTTRAPEKISPVALQAHQQPATEPPHLNLERFITVETPIYRALYDLDRGTTVAVTYIQSRADQLYKDQLAVKPDREIPFQAITIRGKTADGKTVMITTGSPDSYNEGVIGGQAVDPKTSASKRICLLAKARPALDKVTNVIWAVTEDGKVIQPDATSDRSKFVAVMDKKFQIHLLKEKKISKVSQTNAQKLLDQAKINITINKLYNVDADRGHLFNADAAGNQWAMEIAAKSLNLNSQTQNHNRGAMLAKEQDIQRDFKAGYQDYSLELTGGEYNSKKIDGEEIKFLPGIGGGPDILEQSASIKSILYQKEVDGQTRYEWKTFRIPNLDYLPMSKKMIDAMLNNTFPTTEIGVWKEMYLQSRKAYESYDVAVKAYDVAMKSYNEAMKTHDVALAQMKKPKKPTAPNPPFARADVKNWSKIERLHKRMKDDDIKIMLPFAEAMADPQVKHQFFSGLPPELRTVLQQHENEISPSFKMELQLISKDPEAPKRGDDIG